MSERINVIICPKDELGFNSTHIRAKFNDLAEIFEQHHLELTEYLDSVDIAKGTIPTDEFDQLAKDIDLHGFAINIEKTVYAL